MNIRVSDFMIHLHTVWMFTMFEEILMHKITVDGMQQVVEEYIKFEINGWKHILKYKSPIRTACKGFRQIGGENFKIEILSSF